MVVSVVTPQQEVQIHSPHISCVEFTCCLCGFSLSPLVRLIDDHKMTIDVFVRVNGYLLAIQQTGSLSRLYLASHPVTPGIGSCLPVVAGSHQHISQNLPNNIKYGILVTNSQKIKSKNLKSAKKLMKKRNIFE